MKKNQTIRFLLPALVITLLSLATLAPATAAQSASMKADVPFDFYVNDQRMPAGTYQVNPMPGTRVIRLSNREGNSVLVSTTPLYNRAQTQSKLRFSRYGNQLFLSELHWAGSESGKELYKSKLEKMLIADMKTKPAPIAITAK